MSVRWKNLPQVQADLQRRVAKCSDKEVMLYIGTRARQMIIERTRAGKDENGGAFRPYSRRPMYVSLRDRPTPRGGIRTPQTRRKAVNYAKRSGTAHILQRTSSRGGKSMFFPGGYAEYKRNLYGSKVNLTKTGLMLRSLRIKVRRKAVVIGIYDGMVLGRAHGTNEDRPWFGIGNLPEERRAIQQAWAEVVKRHGK